MELMTEEQKADLLFDDYVSQFEVLQTTEKRPDPASIGRLLPELSDSRSQSSGVGAVWSYLSFLRSVLSAAAIKVFSIWNTNQTSTEIAVEKAVEAASRKAAKTCMKEAKTGAGKHVKVLTDNIKDDKTVKHYEAQIVRLFDECLNVTHEIFFTFLDNLFAKEDSLKAHVIFLAIFGNLRNNFGVQFIWLCKEYNRQRFKKENAKMYDKQMLFNRMIVEDAVRNETASWYLL